MHKQISKAEGSSILWIVYLTNVTIALRQTIATNQGKMIERRTVMGLTTNPGDRNPQQEKFYSSRVHFWDFCSFGGQQLCTWMNLNRAMEKESLLGHFFAPYLNPCLPSQGICWPCSSKNEKNLSANWKDLKSFTWTSHPLHFNRQLLNVKNAT